MSVTRIQPTAADTLENEVRNSVRRDVSLRRVSDGESEAVASNIEATLQRVSSLSLSGIDELVADLQTLRDHLADEGERVRRAVADYALLSQSSMRSTKVISESLEPFRNMLALRNSQR